MHTSFQRSIVKGIIKIRSHIDLMKNYRREEEQPLSPLYETKDETTGMCFNFEEMKIENRETSKIILKKNRRKQFRYLEQKKKGNMGSDLGK